MISVGEAEDKLRAAIRRRLAILLGVTPESVTNADLGADIELAIGGVTLAALRVGTPPRDTEGEAGHA